MLEPPQSHYRKSSSGLPALRIGLLLNSRNELPAYAAKIIDDIRASNFAQIVLVSTIRSGQPQDANRGVPLFFDLYTRTLDARMAPSNNPLAMLDVRQTLPEVDVVEITPGEYPTSALLGKIAGKDLDLMIDFRPDSASNEVSKVARYGVWSLAFEDAHVSRRGPAYFWEMVEQNPICKAALTVVRDGGASRTLLCEAVFPTEQTISVSRSRYLPFWGAADLVIQKLHDLHEFGWNFVLAQAVPDSVRTRIPWEPPGNTAMLRWLGPALIKKAVAYPFRKEVVQHWRIGVRIGSQSLSDPEDSDYTGFHWIDPPGGHAWADPFLFENEGKLWSFFEDYSYQNKRGSISCAEVSPQGNFGAPQLCLSHPRDHLSYPHIFRDGSEIFMVPESYESNCVSLYRCRSFPGEWVHELDLLRGRFVDTTIWQHENLWWLLTTSADPMPGAGSMWLYYSSSLRGEWHFHPQNPISRDIRNSRGAGCVFQSGHRLIRPSQTGVPSYGYSLTFNEITELSERRYAEQPIKIVTPEHWMGLAGVHTYNRVGQIELIDGRSARPLAGVL